MEPLLPSTVTQVFPALDGCDFVDEVIPGWSSATVIYRDATGEVIGYGLVSRGISGYELTVSASPALWHEETASAG